MEINKKKTWMSVNALAQTADLTVAPSCKDVCNDLQAAVQVSLCKSSFTSF